MTPVFVSICIPCYKNAEKVKRLLESIRAQTYTSYEIILTDDSPDDTVRNMIQSSFTDLEITYQQNDSALGSPENWNRAIGLASGEWIKIMHHDDYFAHPDSLQRFVDHTRSGAQFIFSDYTFLYLESGKQVPEQFPKKQQNDLMREPMLLNAKNIIGNPSVTMVHNSFRHICYDKRFVWKVDIEYYINLIRNGARLQHIAENLIIVGMSETQITSSVKLNPDYELPEALLLLQRYGFGSLNNIVVYDSYWRMFRQMHIFDIETVQQYAPGNWGKTIEQLLRNLKKSNAKWLQKGIYSKAKMLQSFISRPK